MAVSALCNDVIMRCGVSNLRWLCLCVAVSRNWPVSSKANIPASMATTKVIACELPNASNAIPGPGQIPPAGGVGRVSLGGRIWMVERSMVEIRAASVAVLFMMISCKEVGTHEPVLGFNSLADRTLTAAP
jgi:hypothetical protein